MALSSSTLMAEDFIFYTVKQGDTLSEILFKHDLGPIYGKAGLQKFSAKVNQLSVDGNEIKVGQVLRLPVPINRRVASRSEESLDRDQFHRFILSAQISRLNFESNSDDEFQQSNLKTFSRPVPTLGLSYELHWSERIKLFAFGQFSQISLYRDDEVKFKKLNFTRSNFGLGMGLNHSTSSTELRVGYFDQVFFTFSSPIDIDVDVVPMPEVQLHHFRTIAERKKLKFRFGIGAKAILPAQSTNVEGRVGFGGSAQLSIGSNSRKMFFFYNSSQANARANQTTISEFGLGYGIEGDIYE